MYATIYTLNILTTNLALGNDNGTDYTEGALHSFKLKKVPATNIPQCLFNTTADKPDMINHTSPLKAKQLGKGN